MVPPRRFHARNIHLRFQRVSEKRFFNGHNVTITLFFRERRRHLDGNRCAAANVDGFRIILCYGNLRYGFEISRSFRVGRSICEGVLL